VGVVEVGENYSLFGVAPGFVLFFLFISFTVELVDSVTNSLVSFFSLFSLFTFLFLVDGLLVLDVSVHEQVDNGLPLGVTFDLASKLKHLASEHPEAESDRVLTLVVGGDSNINPVEGGVRVAKSNNWDVHVGGLDQALRVDSGVAHDHEAGFQEFLGVVIGKGTGNPLTTKVVSAGGDTELKDSALSVLTR